MPRKVHKSALYAVRLASFGPLGYADLSLSIFSERELTFTFPICCRPSVCRLSVKLVHPTQAVQNFRNISMALGTLAILDIH